jgi:hypothetical protein
MHKEGMNIQMPVTMFLVAEWLLQKLSPGKDV